MTAPLPKPRLSDLGPIWTDMLSGLASFQADLLRRVHRQMADGLDRDAMSDVEGANDWRAGQGDRYADR